ncbi:MAG: zinc ribbon domain-containing protein [Anaerolineae bacterium]|nr:zinc ribbon domain-containing protein [Anaerolineae bacterium]
MIVCPVCNHRNRADAQSCASCGAPLTGFVYRACPSCGALNGAEQVFCHRCLTELTPIEELAEEAQVQAEAPVSEEGREAVFEAECAALAGEPADVSEPSAREEPTRAGEGALIEVAPELDTAAQGLEGAPSGDEERESQPAEVAPPEADVSEQTEDPTVASEWEAAEALEPETGEARGAQVGAESEAPQAGAGEAQDRRGEEIEPAAPEGLGEAAAPEAPEPEQPQAPQMPGGIEVEPPPDEAPEELTDQDALWLMPQEQRMPDVLAPLAEIEDAIPVETVVALPHRARPTLPMGPSDADRHDAELYQDIAGAPASLSSQGPIQPRWPAAQAGRVQKRRLGSEVARTLLWLGVLLSGLAPIVTGNLTARWVQPREAITLASDAVAAISAEDTVLISFDYSPAYAGELDPLALAVLRQLADRSVPMVALSTQPSGIGSAERAFEALARQMPEYAYGYDYAILGFLPGQEVGLRLLKVSFGDAFSTDHVLGQRLGELPVTQNLTTLEDIDHIILLAEDGAVARRWIEQVQPGSGIDLHAFVSSRIEPLLQPYHQSGQIKTLVGAANGSAEYEIASGAAPNALRWTDGAALFFVLWVIVAIATNVVYMSRGEPGARE